MLSAKRAGGVAWNNQSGPTFERKKEVIMERFISPLVAAMIVGSAASGTSSFDGLRTDRYHDFIQHRRPLRL